MIIEFKEDLILQQKTNEGKDVHTFGFSPISLAAGRQTSHF